MKVSILLWLTELKMWAWFGAGKTHTLRHLEYLCKIIKIEKRTARKSTAYCWRYPCFVPFTFMRRILYSLLRLQNENWEGKLVKNF